MSDIINESEDLEEDEELSENYITLTDDDGEDVSFELLDVIEYNDRNFAVMLPFDDEDGEVIILEIIPSADDSEEDEYISVDDDELCASVFEIFKTKYESEFDFE